MTEEYRVVTNAIITHKGKILLSKKEEKRGHSISGEWKFPGGHLDKGEEPEEAVKREVREETGLNVEVHQIVDVTSGTYSSQNVPLQVIYHCEAEAGEVEANDDLDKIAMVDPSEVETELGQECSKIIENREEVKNLIERIEKAPY